MTAVNNVVKASLRELRLAPRKVSLVAALVRGRSVDDALVILGHTPKRAAKPLAKLIASARANATNNHGLKADGLSITSLQVTAGPRLKRFRPVSRGRAHPFQKRTSHIFVEISGDVKPAKKTEKPAITDKSTSVKTGTNSKEKEAK
jgi:large subunit ribosomal protein L22